MRANRGLVLFLMAALAIAGLALQRGELLGLALPFLVYLGLAYAYAPVAPQVFNEDEPTPRPVETESTLNFSLKRHLSRVHVRPGQPVRFSQALANKGANLDEVRLSGGLPAGVGLVAGRAAVRTTLAAGESVLFQQTVHARRGDYQFAELRVEANETFGLFSAGCGLLASANLSVEPAGEALRPFILRPPQTRGFAGPVLARQGGRGTDFFSVREYQAGDPLRQINWKASSRAPRALYTNVYEQQRIADVGIILDARQPTEMHNPHLGSLFEFSVQAAATLTEPILKTGNRLGILVYGPGMESVFPGYGKVQQRRILRALARAGAGHNFALESLAHLPVRFFPAGSQIILISPLQPEDPPQVAYLTTLGYGVLVISPNPLIFEYAHPVKEGETDSGVPDNLAWRLACAERRIQLQRMQRYGVRVIDWDVRQPLAPILQTALKRG